MYQLLYKVSAALEHVVRVPRAQAFCGIAFKIDAVEGHFHYAQFSCLFLHVTSNKSFERVFHGLKFPSPAHTSLC
jgi:hypothetical protein